MKFPSFAGLFHNKKLFSHRWRKGRVIFWGVVGVTLLLFALVSWDAYLFVRFLHRVPSIATPAARARLITPEEVDEIIMILDEREKQFKATLVQ